MRRVCFGRLVAVGRLAAQPFAAFRLQFLDGANLPARIFCMEFVCPVANGIEIGAACHQRIYTIIDRNETDSLLREVDFCIVTHLQVLTTESAEVLDDESFHFVSFNHVNNLFPGRAHEVCAGVVIVSKEYDILKSVIFCVLLKQNALRRDLSRSVFAKQCAIRIDKQQKERYNNVVIDNDVII